MEVSVSKEFIKVYEQISKLLEDIATIAKDCYNSSAISCEDIPDIPENLSEFNNDVGYITEEQVDNKLDNLPQPEELDDSNFLKKVGEKLLECKIPTIFNDLKTKTQKSEDSSDNVATTEFVHSLVKSENEQTNQYTRFYAKAIEIVEVNNGDIKFIGDIEYGGMLRRMVFTLDHNDVLTTTSITTSEIISNKKNSVVNNLSNDYYASTNAIYNEFLRKPVTIWETTGTGLLSSEQDITANPTWQLTGLDMTPYKRVKIYTKAGKKTSGVGQDASNTPAVVLEMSLDNRAAGPTGGHFMGSAVGQKPNDANRFFTVTCAISADKTSFAVLRMSTLYGTAATANSDCNGYVFKIEGYYD